MIVAASIIRPELDKAFEPMGAANFLTVLVLAIGLYVSYFAISDAIYWLTLWQMSTGSDYLKSSPFGAESKAAMFTTCIELVLASLFVFRARYVSALMLKLSR